MDANQLPASAQAFSPPQSSVLALDFERLKAKLAGYLKAEDLGRAILFVATLPPRACVNELVISPTWNRLVQGGLETPKN